MTIYIVFCIVACATSSVYSASIRYPRQVWPEPFPDHFHFPDRNFQTDSDDFNQVIDFPDSSNIPGNFRPNDFRPPNNRPSNNRPPQMTTPTTTVAWSSTPRTYHLAPEGCDCPFTPQFNPVCGSDGNTYKNAGLLKCFRRCGINVTERRMGAC